MPQAILFQSTPSGGKATDCNDYRLQYRQVSIHAFRGEGDNICTSTCTTRNKFQSTPSGGKATRSLYRPIPLRRQFQSTPSGGKATRYDATMPRSLRVSIHAFRGEGDVRVSLCIPTVGSFNPRLPGGRRRRAPVAPNTDNCFNPRLPGGRRRYSPRVWAITFLFQSTPSGGKATYPLPQFRRCRCCFNPRLPGGRRPATVGDCDEARESFNPRLPGGRRRLHPRQRDALALVSIHAFRGEGD